MTNLAFFNNSRTPVLVEDRGTTWATIRTWSHYRTEWTAPRRIRVVSEQHKTPTALWRMRAATAPQVG